MEEFPSPRSRNIDPHEAVGGKEQSGYQGVSIIAVASFLSSRLFVTKHIELSVKFPSPLSGFGRELTI
jgi:hypothetical protein